MGRWKTPPLGFDCPYKDHCPHMEGLSAYGILQENKRSWLREQQQWKIRDEMNLEMKHLLKIVKDQEDQIDFLQAENRRLHQQSFKARSPKKRPSEKPPEGALPLEYKKRGAPFGHPTGQQQ